MGKKPLITACIAMLIFVICALSTGFMGGVRYYQKKVPMEPDDAAQISSLAFTAEELDAAAWILKVPVLADALQANQDTVLTWDDAAAELSALRPEWAAHAFLSVIGQSVVLEFTNFGDLLILEYNDLDGNGIDLIRKSRNLNGDAVGSITYSAEYTVSTEETVYVQNIPRRQWLPFQGISK